jgi:hypothetical protein
MVKFLTKVGNSEAIVIDKAILSILKITSETPLEITTDEEEPRRLPRLRPQEGARGPEGLSFREEALLPRPQEPGGVSASEVPDAHRGP